MPQVRAGEQCIINKSITTMYAPMTQKDFAALRKLANKAKKHIAEIGKCNEFETHLEAFELQQLRETVTDLLNLTTEIQYKYGK